LKVEPLWFFATVKLINVDWGNKMDSFYVVSGVMGACAVACAAAAVGLQAYQKRQRKPFQPKPVAQPMEIDPNHPWVKMLENQFAKAVEEAIAEHHRNGRPVTVYRDGEMLVLSPENREE
jgi:hypothetical protein